MATTSTSSVSFEETDTRDDEMNSTIERWIDELVAGVDDAQASEEFQEWLDVQSRFHDSLPEYAPHQAPVSRSEPGGGLPDVAGGVRPPRHGGRVGHLDLGTDHHETVPGGARTRRATTRTVTVTTTRHRLKSGRRDSLDSDPHRCLTSPQTDGEPLPDLDTEATGDAGDLVSQLTDAADEIGVTVRIVPAEEWTHGEAKGICEQLSLVDVQPLVEVRDRENEADLARTLIHEYAHALLHFDVDDDTERSKREVEAEAVAYVVGRYCGLDTSGSAFYLAAWGVGRSRGRSRAA